METQRYAQYVLCPECDGGRTDPRKECVECAGCGHVLRSRVRWSWSSLGWILIARADPSLFQVTRWGKTTAMLVTFWVRAANPEEARELACAFDAGSARERSRVRVAVNPPAAVLAINMAGTPHRVLASKALASSDVRLVQ